MKTTYQKFKNELACLLSGENKIAVAVSGGSDSMALVLLLGEFAKESGSKIIALTVDHKLRKESADEAIKVNKWLLSRGIEHHILKWNNDKKLTNIQAKARKARYELMAEFCAKNDIETLCVGHTLDDQAETVLIRLMRGSGIDGLAAIASTSKVFGIRVIRPILSLSRIELRQYLNYENQVWVDDPSNENAKFTRVKVRNLISASESPSLLTKRLADTAIHMSRAKNYIEEKIRQSIEGIVTFHDIGIYKIYISKFRTLHKEERLRVLASALQHIGGKDYKARFKNLSALHDKIMSGDINGGCTLWGCTIIGSKKKGEEDLLFIYREPAAIAKDIDVSASNEISKIQWDGRFICTLAPGSIKDLTIGALTKGGYEALDKSGFKFISLNKELNFSLPKKVIYSLPALRGLEKILAVPHIGYYVDDSIKTLFQSKIKTPPNLFQKV